MLTLFADIIVPFSVPGTFTYRVPVELNTHITAGMRVLIPFGNKRTRLYTGIVRRVHEQSPTEREARYIDSLLDELPIISEQQFEFWEWMSGYYLCHTGEVMNAALPSGLKLSSESVLVLKESFPFDPGTLSDQEFLLIEALEKQGRLTMEEAEKILNSARSSGHIRRLLDKGIIRLEEEVKETIRLKTAKFLFAGPEMHNESRLEQYMNKLALRKASSGRLDMLLKFIDLSGHFSSSASPVRKDILLKQTGGQTGVVKKLIEDGILEEREYEVSRFSNIQHAKEPRKLNKAQETALREVKEGFSDGKPVLLHGVTSSGKTEIYLHLMKEQLEAGKQVLYLLPEISLATQITRRIQAVFGNEAAVYHSRFNEGERAEIWRSLVFAEDSHQDRGIGLHKVSIVVGARSALFLPFRKLGLVIIDEEHDSSFKQQDPSPRYHGRDSALMLARMSGAHALLGSATPSLESYRNALEYRYKLVELKERHGGRDLPDIVTEDLKAARDRKKMHLSFTGGLLSSIEEALGRNEQIILFQNRRGFAPMMKCDHCQHIPKCRNCDVSLTFHKGAGLLKCHYCGYSVAPYTQCPSCMREDMHLLGAGTEKIEEELQILIPQARVSRLDFDTTRSKSSFQKIIESFEHREIDILVGTQMVTKGLDFGHVSLVGIMNADIMMGYPDFRAHERAFQLMSQVAGRAGRGHTKGKVIIQTSNPGHPLLQQVIAHDFEGFYQSQILERKKFYYPPYCRIIRVTVAHRYEDYAGEAIRKLAEQIGNRFKGKILGPETPPVGKIRNEFLKELIIKFDREYTQDIRELLRVGIVKVRKDDAFRQVRWMIDADPY